MLSQYSTTLRLAARPVSGWLRNNPLVPAGGRGSSDFAWVDRNRGIFFHTEVMVEDMLCPMRKQLSPIPTGFTHFEKCLHSPSSGRHSFDFVHGWGRQGRRAPSAFIARGSIETGDANYYKLAGRHSGLFRSPSPPLPPSQWASSPCTLRTGNGYPQARWCSLAG